MPLPRGRTAIVLLTLCACGGETASTSGEDSSSSSGDSSGVAPETSGAPETATSVESSGDPDTSGVAETSTTSADETSSESGATIECGNGELEPGELCDDGNDVDDDECSSLCLPPACGDGIVQRSLDELCDDGNDENLDACPNDCLGTVCGDGFAEGLEQCDHGTDNGNGASTCTAACMLNVCGDGYLSSAAGETCDEGEATGDGTSTCAPSCQPNVCGDGYVLASANEVCDEGDENGVGLCGLNCTDWLIATGIAHTCARAPAGNVRCWGLGTQGSLGYGSTENIGDDETPAEQGDVNVGGTVVDLAAGQLHTCVVLEGGGVKCWGYDHWGRLGYPDIEGNIGDDETPADVGEIDLGGPARQVSCGNDHTCALMQDGTVRCWGYGATGTPGYGLFNNGDVVAIGMDLPPSAPEALVDLGGEAAVRIQAGQGHTCARMESGKVRCWGTDQHGYFGYGVPVGTIGDDETPGSLEPLPIGETVLDVVVNNQATCVRFASGDVRCVGRGEYGLNAAGANVVLGDNETFENVPNVVLGIQADRLRSSTSMTCAIASAGNARCWGIRTGFDQFSYVGDNETPASMGDLPIDEPIVDMSNGSFASCVVTYDGGIRCWGESPRGELGYGNTNNQPLAALAVDLPFE